MTDLAWIEAALRMKRPSPKAGLWFWSGRQWVASTSAGADSFVSIIPFDGSHSTTGDGSCIAVEDSFYC